MQKKVILPMLIGILCVGVTQFAFAEELVKTTYISVDGEQFEQPQSKYNSKQITISGFIENYTRGDLVTIVITYPDQSQNIIETHATKKGEIYTLLYINNDSQIGMHDVILKYRDIELTSTSFEIIKKQ
jgi:hypothetical protein